LKGGKNEKKNHNHQIRSKSGQAGNCRNTGKVFSPQIYEVKSHDTHTLDTRNNRASFTLLFYHMVHGEQTQDLQTQMSEIKKGN
jgi:hypothetical protein